MNTKGISRQLKIKLTYANVIATLALFLALGGGAVAATHLGRASVGAAQLKPGAVTGAKVKDGSLTGADVVAGSLGKVPAAGHADSATSADRAATAGHADSAGRADTAGRADNAGHADTAATATRADTAATADRAALAEALTEPEEVEFFGNPGAPLVGVGVEELESIGFYRDHDGIVHLRGLVKTKAESLAAVGTMPSGFTPAATEKFYGVAAKGGVTVWVYANGSIEIYGAPTGETVSLSGLTWRAYDGPVE
jgi:hypothetical protein